MWDKFDNYIKGKYVICLQEIDAHTSGQFQLDFKKNGYDFYYHSYGNYFNNYMGIAIAVPSDYDVIKVDKFRLSEGKEWPRYETGEAWYVPWLKWASRGYLDYSVPTHDVWKNARGKHNFILTVSINPGQDEPPIHISTVHMPCSFRNPSVMATYAALVMKHAQDIAGDDPYIIAGDFNIKPASDEYMLLTTGLYHNEALFDTDYPPVDTWRPSGLSLKPLRSAVREKHTVEADWTTYAWLRCFNSPEPFMGAIDYIFVSDHFIVNDAFENPSQTDMLCPNFYEPSDHVMVWADLQTPDPALI